MKKILFVLFCIVLIFFIYTFNKDDSILYFRISDCDNIIEDKEVINYLDSKKKLEEYILYKNNSNYRIIDLINEINSNKQIEYDDKIYYLNNLLVKSELIVLNVGHNDLNYYTSKEGNMYKYLNELLTDIDNLFQIIRKYTKENVILLFDYDLSSEYRDYMYQRLVIKTEKYNINLVDSNNLLKYVKNIY